MRIRVSMCVGVSVGLFVQSVAAARQGFPPSPPGGADVCVSCPNGEAQAEVAVAIDPLDERHLVTAFMDWSGAAQVLGWGTSFDGGETWTLGFLPLEPTYVATADPVVIFDVHGKVHLFSLQAFGAGGNGLFHYTSSDGGATFPVVQRLDLHTKNDKPMVSVDRSGGPLHGAISFVFLRSSAFDGSSTDTCHSIRSLDDGLSWSARAASTTPTRTGT